MTRQQINSNQSNAITIYLFFTSNLLRRRRNTTYNLSFPGHANVINSGSSTNLCRRSNTDHEVVRKPSSPKAKDNRKSSSDFPDFSSLSSSQKGLFVTLTAFNDFTARWLHQNGTDLRNSNPYWRHLHHQRWYPRSQCRPNDCGSQATKGPIVADNNCEKTHYRAPNTY
ncbi:Uncharacterized protein Rs2_19461 [Raphanus sativus]|nr:Uncharacterized protein Rs2_19461 [Raphanus sativus]